MPTAFRSVHHDFTSSRGFRWPFPGGRAVAPKPKGRAYTLGPACPAFIGDGLCIAKTAAGAASGGIPLLTVLIVTYRKADVLGEDGNKVRVKACNVVEVIDFPALLRAGLVDRDVIVDLSDVDLRGADLSVANLRGANLRGVNLRGVNLHDAIGVER